MRSARMARNERRGLTPADKQADEKAHAHGNQHGLGGFFLHVFFTRFVKLLGLVTDDFSLFLGVVADGAGLFRSRLADLVYFSRGGLVWRSWMESGDGKLAGGRAGAGSVVCCYGRFKFGLVVLHG
jgi:hypothetical protein